MWKVLGIFALAAVAGIAVLVGPGMYANHVLHRELDRYFAVLPAALEDAGYSDVRLDFWSDRLRIGELRHPVSLNVPGLGIQQATATVRGIVVEGYDAGVLARAAAPAGPDGVVERLADRIAWQSVALAGDDKGFSAETGPGSVDGFAADHLGPNTAWRDVSFARLALTVLSVRTEFSDRLAAAVTFTAGLRSLTAQRYTGDSLDEALAEGLDLRLTEKLASGAEPTLTGRLGRIAVEDWQKGEPSTVAHYDIRDVELRLDAPQLQSLEIEGRPVGGPLLVKVGRQQADAVRFDPAAIDILMEVSNLVDANMPEAERVAALSERLLILMERAVALKTGADLLRIEDMTFDIARFQKQSIKRMEARDMAGLYIGSWKNWDQTTNDADGTKARVALSTLSGMNLNALPAYLRAVFGNPIRQNSLEHAATYFRNQPVADLAPPLDFGVGVAEGYEITLAGSQTVRIREARTDAFRVTDAGDLEIDFAVGGIVFDLLALEAVDTPQAQGVVAAARQYGLQTLDIDFAFGLQVGLRSNEIVTAMRLGASELADIDVSVAMDRVDIEGLRRADPDQAMPTALGSRLVRARISLADLGARGHLFDEMALQQPGVTGDQMATQFAMMARQNGQAMGGPATIALGEQIARFVEEGGILVLETAAEQPLSVLRLLELSEKGPPLLIEALGLRAERTAP